MAATNYSPIQLYYSTTASAAPAAGNLVSGELAINITDGKLYYKDNAGAVQLLSTSTTANGTANGVLYLNGSKVATSGSALTFDGNTTRNNQSSGTNSYFRTTSGTVDAYFGAATSGLSTGVVVGSFSNNDVVFYQNSSEAMRLTSTSLYTASGINVGIGTSSPTAFGSGYTTLTISGSNAGIFQSKNTSGDTRLYANTDGDAYLGSWANTSLKIYTNSTVKATLDSSGNLGLGVTPSAWQSATIRPIEINRIGNFVGGNGTAAAVYLGANARFESANWRYANNGAAGLYTVEDNTHFWRTAASGTAGDAITFTQAMTLNASGDLGVGVTSISTSASRRVFQVSNGASGGAVLLGANATSTDNARMVSASGGADLILGGGGASGIVSIYTNDTERARIDSSGNFLINNTYTTSSKLIVAGAGTSSAAFSGIFCDSNGANLFAVRNDGYIDTGTRAVSPYNNTTASAANMFVDSTGGLYRSTSSLKYKIEVQNATHGLAEVMQLRSVTYKGKTDGDTVFGGLIAEEVHASGLTEFVQYAEDGSPDALAYGNMVSLCIKAIQEQQALIQQLTARVAQLESN